MGVELNKGMVTQVGSTQERQMTKHATDFFVGQVLKTRVVNSLNNNQVLININGFHLNARSSHNFGNGDLLDVEVMSTEDEIILEILDKNYASTVLQNALLLVLPKQAPPIYLFQLISQLEKNARLPYPINQQVSDLLSTIPSLSQLPQQMGQAILQSGMFFESSLLAWKRSHKEAGFKPDFKGQCLKLLSHLPKDRRVDPSRVQKNEDKQLNKDHLPLPGAIPQPLEKKPPLNLDDCSTEGLLHILREHFEQVIARITANQINFLMHDHKSAFQIMLDLPIKVGDEINVIPMMIEQHKTESVHPSRWSLSFALSLTQLGDIQVTVTLSAKNVELKINTDNADTMDILNMYQKEIMAILSNMGLTLSSWKLKVGLENNSIEAINLHLLDIHI